MSDTPPTELVDRLARMFHENYERLAPSFGYETRRESAVPWDKVPEQNRSLMRATVAAVLAEWADGGLIDTSTWTVVDATVGMNASPDHCYDCDGDGCSMCLPMFILTPREGER